MPLNPAHLQPLLGSIDPKGHKLVDYTQHLTRHPDRALAEDYREGVLAAPHDVQPQAVTGQHAHVTTLNGNQFSVSPYFARVPAHAASFAHYPMAGWSQMATQSLYHAGRIGHLVPSQHVVEHQTPSGEFEPMIATHIDHDYGPLRGAVHAGDPQTMADAAKIGFIDFLINNQDRHDGTLLARRMPEGEPTNGLQALGHDRAFQYKRPNRWQNLHSKFDNLFHYLLDSPGMAALAHGDARVHNAGPVDEAVQWWLQHGQDIRSAFHTHLPAIQSNSVRQHVGGNFEARADALDQFTRAWPDHGDTMAFSPYRIRDNKDARARASLAQVPVFIHTPEVV